MRIRFSLRAMFLAISIACALLAFLTPIARVSPGTCAQILPGMSIEQASNIVGASPGWYDGIGGISSDAPSEKGGTSLDWVGIRGQIVVDLDESGRVAKATFYNIESIGWSPGAYFWERLTRVKYMGLTVPMRILFFFGLTAIATLILAIAVIPAAMKNGAAWHGVIGLILGVILAPAMFSEEFIADLVVTAIALLGPVFGALTGIVVGVARGRFSSQPIRSTVSQAPVIPMTVT